MARFQEPLGSDRSGAFSQARARRRSSVALITGLLLLLPSFVAAQEPSAEEAATTEAENAEALDHELLEWEPEQEKPPELEEVPEPPEAAQPVEGVEEESAPGAEEPAEPSTESDPSDFRFGEQVRPDEWSIEWRNGVRMRRKDRRYDLHFGGMFQVDAAGFHLDDDLRLDDDGFDSDVDVRRARIFAQGILLDRMLFKVDYEIAESEFRDVFVGLRGIPWLGTVQVGYLKEPFSLELATSSRVNTFMERSLASVLAPRRNAGILATNTALDGRLRWEAGAFWVSDSFRESDDSSRGFDEDWDLTFRVTGLPIYRDGGRTLLLAGLSYSHRFADEEGASFSSRPESFLVDKLVGTPVLPEVDSIDTIGLELAWVDGSFSVQGELIQTDVELGEAQSSYRAWGGYLQASQFLTGERRAYGRAAGKWGRVVPQNEFAWGKRQLGAVEVAARLSHLDLDDGDVRGGRETNVTLALNWYLLSNLRLAVNGTWGHVKGDGDVWITQTRLQVDF